MAGDPAPDLDLVDADGQPWRLSDHRGRPVVLLFHRHLACPPCREHAVAVRDRLGELDGADVALVLFTRQRNLRGYRSRLAVPFTVATSEDRAAYRAYGLFGPDGREDEQYDETLQAGGDFVVDSAGRLVYAYRSSCSDDRPPVDDLVKAVLGASIPPDPA